MVSILPLAETTAKDVVIDIALTRPLNPGSARATVKHALYAGPKGGCALVTVADLRERISQVQFGLSFTDLSETKQVEIQTFLETDEQVQSLHRQYRANCLNTT